MGNICCKDANDTKFSQVRSRDRKGTYVPSMKQFKNLKKV
jgi:calcium-dependent protein kinase